MTSLRRRLDGFTWWHELVLAAILVALLSAASWIDPAFVRPSVQLGLFSQVWELAILAVPMTLIIITAGIDLSVGSTMALSAVVFGLSHQAGWPIAFDLLLALLTGTLAGLLNGIFVAYVRVHPLIVTLATLSAYRGVAEGISHARPISGFPAWFSRISGGDIAGVPYPAALFILSALAGAVVLARTIFGRSLYAIGYNPTASRFSGIRVARIRLVLYTLAGFTAAVAAILYVSRRPTAQADIGTGMELDVITAVVLGGTSIFGGRGRIIGTVLGVLLIHETRQFVSWHWRTDEIISIVVGVLLVASVILNLMLTPRDRSR